MDQTSPKVSLANGPNSSPFAAQPSNIVQLDLAHLRKQRVIAGFEPCQYVDAYKVLRTRVLQKMREKGWSTLAVTSPNARAGATVAAVNLAISLATEFNQSVLLVDANLRNPGVHGCLGLQPKSGLADYLAGQAELGKIVVRPKGLGELDILPGNQPLFNSAEMMSSPQMGRLVESLKGQDASRVVVFDLPNLQTPDALAFLPSVDAVLLVVEAGATTDESLRDAVEHLHGIPVIGTVLNKSEPTD